MEKIKMSNVNTLSKKELFNAKNNGVKVTDGLEMTIVGVGSFDDTSSDGNAVNVTALKAEDGTIYTTISATIFDCIDLLSDIIADEEKVTVVVHEKTSKNGRNFLQLEIK